MLILPRRLAQQPQNPELDLGHSLARGLLFAWSSTRAYRDLSGGFPLVPNTSFSNVFRGDLGGDLSLVSTGATDGLIQADTGGGSASTTRYNKVAPPLTLVALVRMESSGGVNVNTVICRGNGSSGDSWSIGLWKGTFNGVACNLQTTGGSASFVPDGSSGAHGDFDPTKKEYLVTLSIGPSTFTLWVDGFFEYSASTPAGNFYYEIGADFSRGVTVGRTYNSNAGSVSHLAEALVYDRALTKVEHLALADNPWQIFKPKRLVVGFTTTVAASAGATFSFLQPSTKQPTQPIGVEWSNPLARGLLRLYDFGQVGNNIDVVAGTPPQALSGGKINGVQIGSLSGRGLIGRYFSSGVSGRWDSSFRSRITNQVTWICILEATVTSSSFILADVEELGTGVNSGLYITAGDCAAMFISIGGVWTYAIGTTQLQGTGIRVIVGTYDGTTITTYLDGVAENTNTATGNIDQGSYAVMLNAWNSSTAHIGRAYLGGVANRCWSAGEVKAFSKNPWQLFKGQPKTYAAAPGGVVVVPVYGSLGQFDSQLRLGAWF